MKWKVRYLIAYRDVNRWGESEAPSRRAAYDWVRLAHKSFLEVRLYLGPKEFGVWKRDERQRLQRVWSAT